MTRLIRLLVASALVAVLCLTLALSAGATGAYPGDVVYVKASDPTVTGHSYVVAVSDTSDSGAYACGEVGLISDGTGGAVGSRAVFGCNGVYTGPLK